MARKYKNDYCFTNKDLFENMKWDKLKLPKYTHDKKHKDTRTEYVTDIFMYAFNLILLDIIENNATFVLPLFGNKEGCFYVKKIDGEEFEIDQNCDYRVILNCIDFYEYGIGFSGRI